MGEGVTMTTRARGIIQYWGGKGNMVSKILPLIPQGKIYVEPFIGGGSIFFNVHGFEKKVINDIDEDVINLYRVVKSKEGFRELRHRLVYTPYARAEFVRAIEVMKGRGGSEVDRAWAKMVAQNFVFSGVFYITPGRWGRTFVPVNGVSTNVNSWLIRLCMLDWFHHTLQETEIYNRDAIDVIKDWDSKDTIFYLDPPYVQDTRVDKKVYNHEMSVDKHEEMVDVLLELKGAVVLSGYDSNIYSRLVDNGWKKYEFKTSCHGASRGRGSKIRGSGSATKYVSRVEVVWVKP